ncbi:TetR/AcrR family transcriptional regulator [Mycolicibacterium bacteremicum]|uniref:TetR family transcriptional regulator n=1 Tax=Mycolicibacterium bacteremicum TaxID=564198 RepID=A0A1W9Z141_MYCBA|nr:TetR/AcrR family transcriptional regulator [Mycolicibacterium bacteremicum]MCV7432401.1 TetR/AcrR family transcriptional regulator [Mycolicibacterium bacteremicum]ORA06013.1 TetR family transcriptional regulator [Mycolicibacterium bacteremicum]
MAVVNRPSAREAKRLQTRERLLGAAIAEFKRAGMAEADVAAIVAAAGVAHGTFFFHFPTKEHVLLELEKREEDRMAKQFAGHLNKEHDLQAALNEAVRLVLGLERRLGEVLFKDFLALHFSQTRPSAEDGGDHSLVVLLGQRIEQARSKGDVDPDVQPINSAVFFLLCLYALAITTNDPMRAELLADLVKRTMRSMGAGAH